ncbi:MAG: UDP-N-acetylmuramoyl-L-alanyl-D-glutamate--2,6-diaminopimelate ligase [Candidatus Korobacteraceae bacterium]
MDFQQLLDGAEVLFQRGNPAVLGLEYDSRRVQPGYVFVAMRGGTTDGNRYIEAALAGGAVAVVSDSPQAAPSSDIAWAQVAHGRRALARLSANFYKRPAERLTLAGITGTNGKSTTAFLLESVLKAARRKTALMGTIEYRIGNSVVSAPHTTPESLELNRFLGRALGEGVSEVVMEVSSHALSQERVFGIPYDVAVFTNLTRDHLDYHKTLDDYFEAKKLLFAGVGTEPPRAAVVNLDDPRGEALAQFAKSQGSTVFTYGLKANDVYAEKVDVGLHGTRFDLVTPSGKVPLFSPMIGKVNVYNITAACAAAYARGIGSEAMSLGIEQLQRVPGRFERVDCGQPFTVVVDYAHTDDALRNLTTVAREFQRGRDGGCSCACHRKVKGSHQPEIGSSVVHSVPCCDRAYQPLAEVSSGRVITLFGCGGDRDRSKRPLMAKAAGEGSDFVILTSDNPRSEDPQAIIADALPGLKQTGVPYTVELDRRKAIALAVEAAQPGDIVLLAGKGHEKVQITRNGVVPFDDIQVAAEALQAAGYGKQEGSVDSAIRSAPKSGAPPGAHK